MISDDTPSDASYIIKKLISAKLFDDDQGGMWKRSVKDIEGEVLCVSQFTLFANFKGSKPGACRPTSSPSRSRRAYER